MGAIGRYFTGEPCKRGHIAERFTTTRRCVVCRKEDSAADQKKNRLSKLARQQRYRARHREKIAARDARYAAKNAERLKAYRQAYHQRKPWVGAEHQRTRAARIRRAMPNWVNRDEIKAYYEIAAELTRSFGITYSVDHIVPLAGRDVCGLHVPWNLILMPLDLNKKKGRGPISDLETRYSGPV